MFIKLDMSKLKLIKLLILNFKPLMSNFINMFYVTRKKTTKLLKLIKKLKVKDTNS